MNPTTSRPTTFGLVVLYGIAWLCLQYVLLILAAAVGIQIIGSGWPALLVPPLVIVLAAVIHRSWRVPLVIVAGVFLVPLVVFVGMFSLRTRFPAGPVRIARVLLAPDSPAIIGGLQPGFPAWKAGLCLGDRILSVDGHEVRAFADVPRAFAATASQRPVRLDVLRDGRKLTFDVQPHDYKGVPVLGIVSSWDIHLTKRGPPVLPGSAASLAKPPLMGGDKILQVDGMAVTSDAQLKQQLATNRERPVKLLVERRGKTVPLEISIDPQPYFFLGVNMESAVITAIREGTPAMQCGVRPGDTIVAVKGLGGEGDIPLGVGMDPLRLPEYIRRHGTKEVELLIQRVHFKGGDERFRVCLTPNPELTGDEMPLAFRGEIGVPSLGFAFAVPPVIAKVLPGSPADTGLLQPGLCVTRMELASSEPQRAGRSERPIVFDFEEDPLAWGLAFSAIQYTPNRRVMLTVEDEYGELTAELVPEPADDWFAPDRGLMFAPAQLPPLERWRRLGARLLGPLLVPVLVGILALVAIRYKRTRIVRAERVNATD
jgi:regulator of sigma E protease